MNITFATLAAVLAEIPNPPEWRYCTVSTEQAAKLKEIPAVKGPIMGGIHVYEKAGQVAGAWMFSDTKTVQDYMCGLLTELDLFEFMKRGICQPNENP